MKKNKKMMQTASCHYEKDIHISVVWIAENNTFESWKER